MSIANEIAAARGEKDIPADVEDAPIEVIETDATGKPLRGPDDGHAVAGHDGSGGDDDRLADARRVDGAPGPDDPEAAGISDEEREARRERQRRKRAKAREGDARRRAELLELRETVGQLQQQLQAVTTGQVHTDARQIDARLNDAVATFRQAEVELEAAVTAGDGKATVALLRKRDQAFRTAVQLEQHKAALVQRQPQRQQQQEQPLDPVIERHGKQFLADHPWYDPNGRGQDSTITLAIDHSLMSEGFDPRSEEYWDELRDRVRQQLPHKFKDGGAVDDDQDPPRRQQPRPRMNGNDDRRADAGQRQNGPPARRGPPVGGSGRDAQPGAGKVYISPERKAAMIESGAWDDPVKRQRQLKYFQEFDRQNGATR